MRLRIYLTVWALLFAFFEPQAQPSKKFGNNNNWVLLAWNESTTHSKEFTLLDDGSFAYTLKEDTGANQSTKTYYGKCVYRSHSDTLLLVYRKNTVPPNFTSYLIIEGDQKYLIQHFTNSNKLIFLRLQQIHHRI
jgi:hypothetical protein